MKKMLLILPVMLLLFFVAAKNNEAPKEGIAFFKGSWKDAVAKAKKENKPIFLDIYATWCGPCKLLHKNTFSDKAVAEFYNKSFINVTLDGELGDGEVLANKYRIQGYPALLFFNKDGNPVINTAGYSGPDDFLQLGYQAIQKSK